MEATELGKGLMASLGVLLILGSGIASAGASAPLSVQPLFFSVPGNMGAVQNLGDQTYVVSGGNVVAAAIAGRALDLGAVLTFSLRAQVVGLRLVGIASFDLRGSVSRVPVSASGVVVITGATSVVQPCITAAGSSCGELPVLFGGPSAIQVTLAGAASSDLSLFEVENPYFNPFGAPLLLASADGAVVIVATYDVGTIHWLGSVVGGPISGVLGASTPVSGTIGLVTSEEEDLVAGTAVDSGTITLGSMTPSFLDTSGSYAGTSFIPAPTPQDSCGSSLGLPAGSGICTLTGFDSQGHFLGDNGSSVVAGSYSTVWTVPALAFSSTITAVAAH